MSTSSPKFTDGRLHETLVWSRPRPRFPFLQAVPPDRHARLNDRKFLVIPDRYVPKLPTRTSYTNHLIESNNFGTSWIATGVGVTADSFANPWDGATTVDRLPELAPITEHRIAQAHTFAAVSNCLWAIVNPSTGRDFARLLANDGTTNFVAFFDLVHAAVFSVAGSGCTAFIRRLEDGFLLIYIVFTPLAAAGNVYLNASTDGTTVSYAGDTAKGLYVAQMQLERASAPSTHIITTTTSRTILCPDIDPLDMFAYLELESDPSEFMADMWVVSRTFARIPRAQLSYPGARTVQKPDYTASSPENPYTSGATPEGNASLFDDLSSLGAASYGASTGLYTSGDSKVYNPVKVPSAQAVVYATAGTFTLTYKTSTTAALAYNAASATIAAAINGLADIITDGITATVPANGMANSSTGGGLDISLTGSTASTPAITMNGGSLTLNIANNNPRTQKISSSYQQIKLPLQITVTAHGLNTALALVVAFPVVPETLVYASGSWGSYDANTIWIPGWRNNTVSAQLVGTYASTYSGPAASTYVAGSRTARNRLRTSFYLPGVSPGITALEDIVGPATYQNPDDMLAALLAGVTGWQNYENDGPGSWLGSALHKFITSEIYFNDLT